MTFTKIAVAGFLALLGFFCWLAATGFGAARELLISLFVLVLLVGGGNLLAGRGRSYGRSGSYGRGGGTPARGDAAPEPGDGVEAARSDEPAP